MSPRGQNYARSLAREINAMEIAGLRVWTSQLKRTQQTAAAIKAQMESLDALNELEAVSQFADLCKLNMMIIQTIGMNETLPYKSYLFVVAKQFPRFSMPNKMQSRYKKPLQKQKY